MRFFITDNDGGSMMQRDTDLTMVNLSYENS